jgi:hypothetical protein
MQSESKVWLIAGLGLVVLMLGVLSHFFQGAESPPAAAVFESRRELVQLDRHGQPLLEQPTILKADSATQPLLGEVIESPRSDSLTRQIEPFVHDHDTARPHRTLMPLGFLRDDLPLIPPSKPVPQP